MILLPKLQYRATNKRRCAQPMTCFHFHFLLTKGRSAGESESYYHILSLEGKKTLTSEELAWYSGGSGLLGGSVVTFAVYFQLGISNRNVLRHHYAFAINPVFLQIITCGSWVFHLYKADWILSGCFTYVFPSQERWFFQDYSPDSKWKDNLSPTLEKESEQRDTLISGHLHFPQANTMYPPA